MELEFDPIEKLRLRLEKFDRQAVRNRIEAKKKRWNFRERIRAKQEICQFPVECDSDSGKGRICGRPAEFLDHMCTDLCREHLEIEDQRFQQELLNDPERSYGISVDGTLFSIVQYLKPNLIDLLKRVILFRLLDDDESDLFIWPVQGGPYWDRLFYVQPLPPDHSATFTSYGMPLSEWLDCLLKAGVLEDQDFIWAEKVAGRAFPFFNRVSLERLIGVSWQLFNEAAFHGLDEAITDYRLKEIKMYSSLQPVLDSRLLRLKSKRNQEKTYDLDRLGEFHKELKPIWANAKRCAHEAQSNSLLRARWRDRVSASYEVELPDDLVEWLNEDEANKLTQLQSFTRFPLLGIRLREGYRLSGPSEIALEHATRLCGAPPYAHAPSYLWKIRGEQNRKGNHKR